MNTPERTPGTAPGDLEFIRSFVNSVDLESGVDDLVPLDAAASWFRQRSWAASLDQAALDELVVVREVLRDVVSTRGTADQVEAEARLDAIASRYPVLVKVSSGRVPLTPSTRSGVGAIVERILCSVAAAVIDGEWERMKTCANDRCRWLFYDHSRNRSRSWCNMETCGAQAKMRTYRQRQAARRSH